MRATLSNLCGIGCTNPVLNETQATLCNLCGIGCTNPVLNETQVIFFLLMGFRIKVLLKNQENITVR